MVKYFIPILLLTSGLAAEEISEQDSFRNGIVLLKNGKTLKGEYSFIEQNAFVRDEKTGITLPKSEVLDIVSEKYYENIKHSSKWKSAGDSLLYFNSSARSQWQGENSAYREDIYSRSIKISLLLLTAFFYGNAVQSNAALQIHTMA